MDTEKVAFKNNTNDNTLAAALAMQKKIKKRQKIRCVPNCGRGAPDVETLVNAIKPNWHAIQAEVNGDSEEEQKRIRDVFNAFAPECAE